MRLPAALILNSRDTPYVETFPSEEARDFFISGHEVGSWFYDDYAAAFRVENALTLIDLIRDDLIEADIDADLALKLVRDYLQENPDA